MIIDFAAAKRSLAAKTSSAPWCGPCSDKTGERQFLAPLLAPRSRVLICPCCCEEFEE